ncbi:hypothetical protein FHL15_003025 [Xylaria flabelliformis]|uniref:Thioester reductase (TE) domain-containing protein n=1 Tax=Xylaria flabelliformis TaxID=2512241 RepID=A0A553I6Q9_9PEZI|nr:hypothetical protein FHL15_003025 [Xylaria flabelliformis]
MTQALRDVPSPGRSAPRPRLHCRDGLVASLMGTLIRDFRIELDEIDNNLSQSPLICDCKTLVRRDRYEEQILVSYIVHKAAEWRRFLAARAIDDIEDECIEMDSASTSAGFAAEVEKQLKKASGIATEETEEGDPVHARVLGSCLVKDILERIHRELKLVAYIRGVKDASAELDRLKRSPAVYELWNDQWLPRLSCVVGDPLQPKLGMSELNWQRIAREPHKVIYNSASSFSNKGKPETFVFVSSTSVLDTDHYIKLSEEQVRTGQCAIYKSNDMRGSRCRLGNGYGQTKWVPEQLVREAGNRGLIESVIRAGYVLGDMLTGFCNMDDFLVRMLKDCVQLAARPRIVKTVNAVHVNHVSRLVVASALNPIADGVNGIHVTAHPKVTHELIPIHHRILRLQSARTTRAQALALKISGRFSNEEIERTTGMTATSVNPIVDRGIERGLDLNHPVILDVHVANGPRLGRPSKQAEAKDRILEKVRRDGRQKSCARIAAESDGQVSAMTVWRILRSAGIERSKPTLKPGPAKEENGS